MGALLPFGDFLFLLISTHWGKVVRSSKDSKETLLKVFFNRRNYKDKQPKVLVEIICVETYSSPHNQKFWSSFSKSSRVDGFFGEAKIQHYLLCK